MEGSAPPAKRARSYNTILPRLSFHEVVLRQVTPLVARAIARFPANVFRLEDIAVKCITLLYNKIRVPLDESRGCLSASDQQKLSSQVEDIIRELIKLPQYHVQPNISTAARQNGHTKLPPLAANAGLKTTSLVSQSKRLASPARKVRTSIQRRYSQQGEQTGAPLYLTRSGTGRGFSCGRRPYLCAADRRVVSQSLHMVSREDIAAHETAPYHIDFTAQEITALARHVSRYAPESLQVSLTPEGLRQLCLLDYPVPTLADSLLPGRTSEDLTNFCSDLLACNAVHPRYARSLALHSEERKGQNSHAQNQRQTRISQLLMAREMEGNIGFGRTRSYANFQNEFALTREEGLSVVAEFTNCAGDIVTISWLSNNGLVCGCTAHSDSHNQQYNKPGNLLICSTQKGTLRALPDHRIARPAVEKGDNSTVAMRGSQDPWLYTSVVSSDFDARTGLAYTSAFDKTVKIWRPQLDGSSIRILGTWHHQGKVNFVAVAKDQSGRVATAADVPSEAIRIYSPLTDQLANPSASAHHSFSSTRTDSAGSDKWAYYPATMQWGRAPGTRHLLAVGYSPRSLSGDDDDIPEDKRNTGEILLWNAETAQRVPVMTASTANVFEIIWHPTLMRFVVATTPCGLNVDAGVRTQIHLFEIDLGRPDEAYRQYQSLDCPALDINELTMKPNSTSHAYVTASCTDGNVYVWDTAQGDKPIHVLRHGPPLEECIGIREREDCGVNLTVWGSTSDRFYTGSSDGVVKVWNVRSRQPFVRDLLRGSGSISCGVFSPDMTKFAVGDASGRLYLLSIDERDAPESHLVRWPGKQELVRRPQHYIPHPEPSRPINLDDEFDEDEGTQSYSRRVYLETGKLRIVPNRVIGAVQGPQYALSGHFRPDAHLNSDPAEPLLTMFEQAQQDVRRMQSPRRAPRLEVPVAEADIGSKHEANAKRSFDPESQLGKDLLDSLRQEGAVLDWDLDYDD